MERPKHPALPSEQPKPRKRTPTRENILASAPWVPPKWEKADASALQAMERGDASQGQQQRALLWIVHQAAGAYDMPFRPGGEDGRRDTDFALGRMFVGQQIVKLLRVNVAALPNDDQRADPVEPQE